jgi:hypothetical protein
MCLWLFPNYCLIMVTLPSWPVSTNFCTWPYRCLLSNSPPNISLYIMLKCSSAHAVSCLSLRIVLLLILDMPIWSVPLSHQTVYSLHLLSDSVCDIFFVAWYLVWNSWSCAAIISLSVSPFRSPLDSHRNVIIIIIIIFILRPSYSSHFCRSSNGCSKPCHAEFVMTGQ